MSKQEMLMLHSSRCADDFCKASLWFETFESETIKRKDGDGVPYYQARCTNCQKEYRVKAQPDPVKVTPPTTQLTDAEVIADMALLIRRLARHIHLKDPANDLARRSIDYVNDHVGKPTPLRNENGNT